MKKSLNTPPKYEKPRLVDLGDEWEMGSGQVTCEIGSAVRTIPG
jgi:hypothetical protein